MKYAVKYQYKSTDGSIMNTDHDNDLMYKNLLEFLQDNHIQYRFVNEHGFRGNYQQDPAFWHIVHDTLYFYRIQDRNLFLLHFNHLYRAA